MNTVSILTVYASVVDDSDGGLHDRPRPRTIGHFTDSADATNFAKGKGAWGGNGEAKPVQVLAVHGPIGTPSKYYELVSPEPIDLDGKLSRSKADLLKEALAKLSPEQIEAIRKWDGKQP